MQRLLDALLHLLATLIPLPYLVLDGHVGHHNAVRIVQQCQLHRISQLRSDAALYMPYEGPYAGRGPHRTDGSTLEYRRIPAKSLNATPVENPLQTRVYQAHLRPKAFAHVLHVGLSVTTHRHTHAQAPVILFSSDLDLAYDTLRDYSSRRVQIEVNFRDAKQYGGLEDFMHVTPTGVPHAVKLAWFMVKVADHRQAAGRQPAPDYSSLDWQADCRRDTYVEATINMLPEQPEPVL